jgi:tellurite resistance protein TerC
MKLESIGSPALWIGFTLFVLAMLALDLGVFHRRARTVRVTEALGWTAVWIALALVFNLGLYLRFGAEPALEFFTGYVMEKSLSVDNLFVFLLVFSAFGTPPRWQHRVLFWGIFGALILRALFIGLGAALLEEFDWVAYVFGALVLGMGIKMLIQRQENVDPQSNPLVRWFGRVVPMSRGYRGGRFTVVEAGRRLATPLLMVLMTIEAADIVFALDSIPAVFAITEDPFIVFSSNIFAVLGLRALYFALAGMLGTLRYLRVGLSLVLVFVGSKMILARVYETPTLVSLGIIAAVLGGAVVASLWWKRSSRMPIPRRSPQRQPYRPALAKP